MTLREQSDLCRRLLRRAVIDCLNTSGDVLERWYELSLPHAGNPLSVRFLQRLKALLEGEQAVGNDKFSAGDFDRLLIAAGAEPESN